MNNMHVNITHAISNAGAAKTDHGGTSVVFDNNLIVLLVMDNTIGMQGQAAHQFCRAIRQAKVYFLKLMQTRILYFNPFYKRVGRGGHMPI